MQSLGSDGHQGTSGRSTSNGFAEKRRHERLGISVNGDIYFGNARISVKLLDLSKSGALMKITQEALSIPQVGTVVDLALAWPMTAANKSLQVEARLVRRTDELIAVEFTHLAPGTTIH